MRVIFTAQSKKFFFCRDAVCEWVLQQGCLPINPFRVFDYFLGDRVDRNLIRQGNNNLLRISDEVWVFGIVADGVLFEIEYALSLGKRIRFFNIATRASEIREIFSAAHVQFEPEVHAGGTRKTDLVMRIRGVFVDNQMSLFARPENELDEASVVADQITDD